MRRILELDYVVRGFFKTGSCEEGKIVVYFQRKILVMAVSSRLKPLPVLFLR
jgi:hypothetical protein